ncbi:MAG: DUF5606 domain-containing protein [Bacteroidia bacterium]
MKLNQVVALAGVSGLHKIIKADAKSVILEALDATQKRQKVAANMMVSKLSDISIYTLEEGAETSTNLVEVLKAIQAKYANTLPVNKKSSNTELMAFLAEVLPNYDTAKVYASNVKKLVAWYEILVGAEVEFAVDVEENAAEETEAL